MIDTLVLRLHDLSYHAKIVRVLTLVKNEGSTDYFKVSLDNTALDIDLSKQKIISERLFHRSVLNTETGEIQYSNINVNPYLTKIEYKDSGKSYHTSKRGSIELPSCHYSVAYFINYERDFIEFNFSIPKYLYGTNVFQFVPHYFSKVFDATRSSSFHYNIPYVFNRLVLFIKDFFNCEFPTCKLNYTLLEINRIDICFNQVFHTEDEARQYLDCIRLVKKKYARDNNFKDTSPFGHNVFYKTSLYGFKIYHKGDEFLKNDLRQLQKLEGRGFKAMDTDLVLSLAMRTLRYEITIHNKYLSYIYYDKVFRCKCPLFIKDKARFSRVRSLIQKRDDILQIYSSLDDPLFSSKNTENYYIALTAKSMKSPFSYIDKKVGITRKDEAFYRYFTNLTSNRLRFTLSNDDDSYFSLTPLENDTTTPPTRSLQFSISLFKECCLKFWSMVSDFKASEKLDLDTLNRAILEHNRSIHLMKKSLKNTDLSSNIKGFNIQRLQSFVISIQHFGSFDKAVNELKISRTTAYRLKQDLKFFGFSDKSVLPYPIHVPLNYEEYHRFVLSNFQKLFFFKRKANVI